MSTEKYVVGVDYGTLSGRAVVARVSDGVELGSAVLDYHHAVMDTKLASSGATLGPDWALQDANDYVAVLKSAVPAAIKDAGIDPADVIGIATDFTACTMVPVKIDGTPLSQVAGFALRATMLHLRVPVNDSWTSSTFIPRIGATNAATLAGSVIWVWSTTMLVAATLRAKATP